MSIFQFHFFYFDYNNIFNFFCYLKTLPEILQIFFPDFYFYFLQLFCYISQFLYIFLQQLILSYKKRADTFILIYLLCISFNILLFHVSCYFRCQLCIIINQLNICLKTFSFSNFFDFGKKERCAFFSFYSVCFCFFYCFFY